MCSYLKKISIIIPVYNTASYLKQCLNSVIAIPIIDKEIIVINDGSTDNSLAILNEYIKENVIIVNTCNDGLSAARNCGLNMSSGEYILFVDSDDYILPAKVLALVEMADKYKTEVLLGRYLKCTESGEFLSELGEGCAIGEALVTGREFYNGRSLNDATIIVAWLKLCRRDFLEKYQIHFVKGLYHEDVIFSFLCSKYAVRFIQTNIIFYIYRQRATSIVHTPSVKKQIHKFFIVNYICTYIEESDSEFWYNLAVGIYFDVLRRAKIKNKQLFTRLILLKKMRFIQKIKLVLIQILQIFASEKQIKI